jgi:hypothetical protein
MKSKMAEKEDNEQHPKKLLLSNFVYVDEDGIFKHRWLMNKEIVGVFEWEKEIEFFAEIYDDDI